ncbi:hypothetical protein DFQ28_008743 [Apophysomyces sp. BC1034]|nr:hypothetical protein DFQ30_003196 [Apophysomyces sp. BC1015]KAG0179444.1 hypothetical protein DFQ29_002096 [Apophysomyces sp. BC1021]KAG0185813.1 hypothetical protein DFQ28_008743 [Apophysomyces sp. BC1034]
MIDEEKWEISPDVFVENKMYKFASKLSYEHPAHSFIHDLHDSCWEYVFTKEELKQLQTAGQKLLPKVLPPTTVEVLWNATSTAGKFDLADHFDEDWAQRSELDIISLYIWNILPRMTRNNSERDFWRCADLCFDNIGVETLRGDQTCVSTSVRLNKDRSVSSVQAERKINFLKPDLILVKDEVEYGCAETGAANEGGVGGRRDYGTRFKAPQNDEDMLLRLYSKLNYERGKLGQL